MNRANFIRRFDEYFGHRNDERILELRKYIGEYFALIGEVPEAYVPRIFVNRWEDSNSFSTAVTWSNFMCTVFPPTDFIMFTKGELNSQIVTLLGYTETDSLLQKLSPFLHRLSGYTLTKRLSSEYVYTQEMEDMLRNYLKPMPDPNKFVGVDMLPSFKEEMTHYEHNKMGGGMGGLAS